MLKALTMSRNLDSQENTVLSRKVPIEGAASCRSETILLAKAFIIGSWLFVMIVASLATSKR